MEEEITLTENQQLFVNLCDQDIVTEIWESFEFETVIRSLLRKSKIIPEDQVNEFLEGCRKDNLAEINRQFGFIAGFAKLGEILCDNTKDKNDFKARILKAGLADRGLLMPDDWNELTEEEKEKRLNNVIKSLNNVSLV